MATGAVVCAHAWAAGAPDPAFSGDGLYTFPAECCAPSRANAVVVQADGKSVYAGYATNVGARDEVIIVRLNADGTPDAGFAASGTRRLGLTSTRAVGTGIALQSDGRIVVAGHYQDAQGAWRPFVARLLSTGAMDTGFGAAGVATLASLGFGESQGEAHAMALQPDGRIVVAGTAHFSIDRYMYAARLDANGSLDASFGSGGAVRLTTRSTGSAVSVAADGGVIVVGQIQVGAQTSYDGGVVRFTSSGSLDATFDADGIKSPLAPFFTEARRVEQSAGGRILIAGQMNNTPTLFHLMPSGQFDTTFAGSGAASFGSGQLVDLMIGGDGLRYTLEWDGTESGRPNAQLRRFNVAGQLDASWVPPKLEIQASNQPIPADLAAGTGGGLFVATGMRDLVYNDRGSVGAYKRLPSGSPDPSFGEGGSGMSVLQLGLRAARNGGFAVDPGGNIWVLRGVMCPRGTSAPAVHCGNLTVLMPNGEPHPSYPPRLFVVPDGEGLGDGVHGLLARRADGKLLYAYAVPVNRSNQVQTLWRLRQLHADATNDPSFPMVELAQGRPSQYPPGNPMIRFYPDGRILYVAPNTILRLLPDGTVDSTFNGGLSIYWAATDVVLLSAGGFIASMESGNPQTGSVRKFTAAGDVDASFGTNGAISISARSIDRIAGLPDGKTLVAGRSNGLPYIMRLTAAGAVDSTFGVLGVVTVDGYGSGIRLNRLRVQDDGKIVLMGTDTVIPQPGWRGFVARFNADGSRDTAFGNDGVTYIDVPGVQDLMADMEFHPDGGIVASAALGVNAVLGEGAIFKILGAPPNPPRLANISTRAPVLTGDDVLIGGFIIGGSAPKTVLLRARGPSLAAAGVPKVLVNPVLNLYSGQTVIASNDDWQTAANASAVQSSGFAPSDSRESAIYTTLNPGAYTAIVQGVGGTTGVGIVEVFEVDAVTTPLVNIATRGPALTGNDVMIGGFIIQGSSPQTVVVRARGPSLAAAGVPNVLVNPVLNLYAGQTLIASSDDWQTSSNASTIQSSGFAPSDARESAIHITLAPGAYTAIVQGVGGTTGVGIVEVFAVP